MESRVPALTRSLLPSTWSTQHENAWSWFWTCVEKKAFFSGTRTSSPSLVVAFWCSKIMCLQNSNVKNKRREHLLRGHFHASKHMRHKTFHIFWPKRLVFQVEVTRLLPVRHHQALKLARSFRLMTWLRHCFGLRAWSSLGLRWKSSPVGCASQGDLSKPVWMRWACVSVPNKA